VGSTVSGLEEFGMFPFSSNSIYHYGAYDLVKTRMLESEAEEPTNYKGYNGIL